MRRRRWLKGLTAAVLAAAASGLALFLPPFSLWPLYPLARGFHAWLGLLAAVPFLLALLLHTGRGRPSAGPGRMTWTGTALCLSFLLVLGTGLARMLMPRLPTWWLVAHLLAGSLTILFALMHGARVRLDR